jgi:hypothetical protein
MSQTPNDPAGTTHQFQNFANKAEPHSSGAARGKIVAALIVVLVVVVLGVAIAAL